MQLTIDQVAKLSGNLKKFMEVNELTARQTARRLRMAETGIYTIRDGKARDYIQDRTAEKIADGMGRTFEQLSSEDITDFKKGNGKAVKKAKAKAKKAKGKKVKWTRSETTVARAPAQAPMKVSSRAYPEPGQTALLVDVDGIIYPRMPAEVWPYDDKGTTAVKIGGVLVLVNRENNR